MAKINAMTCLPEPEPEPDNNHPLINLPSTDSLHQSNSQSKPIEYLPHAHQALAIGTTATGIGFQVARSTTQLGFSFSRGVISKLFAAVTRQPPSSNLISSAINSTLSFAEWCALQGIGLGDQISKTSLDWVSSTVSRFDQFYKTHLSDQYTSFKALKLFVQMVRKHWRDMPLHDPPGGISSYGLLDIFKAISCWALLQNLTNAIYSRRIIGDLEEIQIAKSATQPDQRGHQKTPEAVLVDRETEIGSEDVQILTGELVHSFQTNQPLPSPNQLIITSDQIMLQNFKSYAGLSSTSYGGVGYLLFGGASPKNIPPTTTEPAPIGKAEEFGQEDKEKEEEFLVPGSLAVSDEPPSVTAESQEAQYRTWDLLTGKHDRELLQHFGELHEELTLPSDNADMISDTSTIDWYDEEAEPIERSSSSPINSSNRQAPRYFILTDQIKKKVILCLRGTFSLDDLATDLTCECVTFDPDLYWDLGYPDPLSSSGEQIKTFKIHSGFSEVAKMIGNSKTGALHKTLSKVLRDRPGYSLDLVGHSLGAGVATILALMWADPRTTKTTRKGGLPFDIPVKVYGMAPPCSVSATLSRLSRKMIGSFVYSSDAISRLSLGHVLDLKTVVAWICYSESLAPGKSPEEEEQKHDGKAQASSPPLPKERESGIWAKVIQYHRVKNLDNRDERQTLEMVELEQWLISARKTLEANLVQAELFPPGQIFWYLPVGSEVKFPSPLDSESKQKEENLLKDEGWKNDKGRLFKVTGDVEKVFGHMIFSKEMLGCHLPHCYLKVIQDEI